jgi:thiosulfate dehydrogenase
MKRIFIITIILLVAMTAYSLAQMGHGMMRGDHMMEGGMNDYSPINYNPQMFSEDMRISRGGQLYDNWWKTTVDSEKPKGEHPLWKAQETNKRSGYATYRCKECHGWDYRGKDGAYGRGSHYTGFKGVYDISQKSSIKEIEAALRGSTNRDHDFSRYLKGDDITDLALFLKKGLSDASRFIDSNGIPLSGDINSGSYIFNTNCAHMCHGGPGTMINFGDREKPEFIGTVASKNPWELIHKVRAGQPGTRMPSAIINKWRDKDIIDLLSYTRTLPKDFSDVSRFSHMMGGMGHHQWSRDSRGFGPVTK